MKDLRYNFFSLEDRFKEVLDKEDVNLFGFTIEKEKIHLVYLLKNGDLIYSIFSNGNWTKALIGKFDIKSNRYNQLEVLYINDRLNIFYAYSNYINSNIFTLHHVIYKDNIEARYNIIRYISKKSATSFTVDYDSNGNIHLMYSTIINDLSYIYYTNFNPYKSSWLNNSIKLSQDEKNNENPFIMVDSLNNIHAISWEKSSNNYILKYFRRSSSGKDIYKWIDMNSLKITSPIPSGILIDDVNSIKLIYGDEFNYNIVNSDDYGLSWKHIIQKKVSNNVELIHPKAEIEAKELVENHIGEQIVMTIEEKNMIYQKIEQLLNVQNDLTMLLNDKIEEIDLLKSKVMSIEDYNKRGFFKKLFG